MGIYLLACLLFVVSDFIEFAFVLYLNQENNNKKVFRQKHCLKHKEKVESVLIKEREISTKCIAKPIFNIRKIDRMSFLFGSVLFIVFNVMYWTTFLIL